MSLKAKFMPNEETLKSFNFSTQKRISALVTGNIICSIMFLVLAAPMFPTKKFLLGICLIFCATMFIVSNFLSKKGKVHLASWFTSGALFVACCMIAFIASKIESDIQIYRAGCFFTVMTTFNYMISLKKQQLVTFMISVIILLAAYNFVRYMPEIRADLTGYLISLIINEIAIVAASVILISSNKQNEDIIKHAEADSIEAKESLSTITNVLGEAKESMNVGQRLNKAADEASSSVDSIMDVYNNLVENTAELEKQSIMVQDASQFVTKRSNEMNESMIQQNNSIGQMSNSMKEISDNITKIDEIAVARQRGMESITGMLDEQANLIRKLVEEVEAVKESSEGIGAFVATVDSIAGQTSLLAMNASIEAAHAGESGKGFSVIAQEIRKLSEETTRNANKINETLQSNNQVVTETSESVQAFATATQKSSTEIKATIDSMNEILVGIKKMDNETNEIMVEMQKLVSQANDNTQTIGKVVEQIGQQDMGINTITESANHLKDRVNSISGMLSTISSAMEEVHNCSKENEEVSGRIASLLN